MHYTYTEDGQTRQYSDRKRYLWLLALSTPFLLTLAIWAFVQTGQHWLLACPIVYLYGVLPVLDYVLGEDINNPPEAVIPQLEADRYYTRLLLLTVPGLVLNVVVAGYAVTQLDLSGWLIALVTLTSGVISGGLGLTISHELGHRGGKFERFAALVASSVSLYGHFNIEHNRGHHVNVATPEDCASSRFNETLYQFSWREQWGALVRGWRSECQRLNAKKLAIWSVHNQILQSYAMTLVLWGISVALFGWSVLWFLIAQSYVGQWHLTLANYVEHYGLGRKRRENGRYEPCLPYHSWNTNHIPTNLLLFHLQRHSDHHAHPTRPYQTLRNFDELPRLPSGYPGCFLLALVPPLWFKVMNPKVERWVAEREEVVLNRG